MVKEELTGIQYLRAIAAVLVVLDHATGMGALPKYFGRSALGGLFTTGFIGVDIFFVISGFVVAYVSWSGPGLAPRIDVKTYALRRFARIIPFLWLCVLAYAALRWAGRGAFETMPYVRALFLIPGGELKPNVVWTLRHEGLFYALAAFTLISSSARRFAPLLAWLAAPFSVLAVMPHLLSEPDSLLAFFANPLNVLFGFGLAVAIVDMRQPSAKPKRLTIWHLLFITALLFEAARHLNYDRTSVLHVFMFGVGAAVLVVASVRTQSPRRNAFERVMYFLGNASYAIYLTHEIAISGALGLLVKAQPVLGANLAFLTCVVIAIAMGSLIHVYIERPTVAFVKKLLLGRKSQPVSAGV